MDTQTAAVDARLDDLRRLSAELHFEREAGRSGPSRASRLRLALGRRLVSFGTALLDEPNRDARAVAGR